MAIFRSKEKGRGEWQLPWPYGRYTTSKVDQSNNVESRADPANRIRKPKAQMGLRTLAYTKNRLTTNEIAEEAINALLNSYFFMTMSMMKNADRVRMIAIMPDVESLA